MTNFQGQLLSFLYIDAVVLVLIQLNLVILIYADLIVCEVTQVIAHVVEHNFASSVDYGFFRAERIQIYGVIRLEVELASVEGFSQNIRNKTVVCSVCEVAVILVKGEEIALGK